jgi:hypothetical protein
VHVGELVRDDGDDGADGDLIEELDDIPGTHPDAAPAHGLADGPFLGGAVDVDAAAAGVAVLGLEAIEPDDAGDDGVAARGVDGEDLAGGGAVADDGAGGQVFADLIADAQLAKGGAVTIEAIAGAELRS